MSIAEAIVLEAPARLQPQASRLADLPGAAIYEHRGRPYAALRDQDLLCIAALDRDGDQHTVALSDGTPQTCSCELWAAIETCAHTEIAGRYLLDHMPSAIHTAAALASDAAGLARIGRANQAWPALRLAKRLVQPHVGHWPTARQVADAIDDVESILLGMVPEVCR